MPPDLLESHPWLGALLAAALTTVGLYAIIGPVLLSPNALSYSFGGDALVLYYDLAYHVCHGAPGATLDAMLYPGGELIFLTDAQGALAVTLQWVSRNVTDLCPYVVGIAHTLNAASFVVAAVLVYAIAVRLGSDRLTAALLAPFVILLSPQILRIGGHFGLAYAFGIPMVIAWLLRRRTRPDLLDAGVAVVLCWLTFNNPYVGLSAGGTALLACALLGLHWWQLGANRLAAGPWAIPAVGITLALLIPFAYFRLHDPYDTRLAIQWGVFDLGSYIMGSLSPHDSLPSRLFGGPKKIPWESFQYLGLVPVLALLGWVGVLLRRRFRKTGPAVASAPTDRQLFDPAARHTWLHYVLAAAIVYLLCHKYDYGPATRAWIEARLGFLTLFKAIGRLAWPAYFAVALSAVVIVARGIASLRARWRWAPAAAYALVLFVWSADIGTYAVGRYGAFENNVRPAYTERWMAGMRAAGVEAADYQAILPLPRLLTWNDNVLTPWRWGTHFAAVQTSLGLGLPLVTANLGRAPLRPLLDVTQLVSDPLIPRGALLARFPDQRPLLVLVARAHPPATPGERWVVGQAREVFAGADVLAYRLELADLADPAPRATWCTAPLAPTAYLHAGFDAGARPAGPTDEGARPYAGAGALRTPARDTLLAALRLGAADTSALVSVWTYATHRRHDLGYFTVEVLGPPDSPVSRTYLHAREASDAQDGWLRSVAEVSAHPGDSVRVLHTATQPLWIDELLVRGSGAPDVRPAPDVGLLVDGIRLDYSCPPRLTDR